jgi:hypothetical protein
VPFGLLATEARTKIGERGAHVAHGQISNPRYRLRPLPAAPLVARRRSLIVVPRSLPSAPLAVCRRYLIVFPRPLPRCASQVLCSGAQTYACGLAQVLDRGAQAVARGIARCASQLFDRGAQADARGAAQILDRGAQAVARGSARCVSQVLDRGA